MPTATEKRPHVFAVKAKHSWLLRLAASPLVVAGCLIMSLPSVAADIPTSYRNKFRACAGRLEDAGISGAAAATACAQALYPVDLSRCVNRIAQQTAIAAEDALATCSQVREPVDVARCVVGISRNTPEAQVPGVLGYCGRSLLPATYGECVIGLRREIEIATTQALETCISTSDRPSEFAPTFIPQSQLEQLQPLPEPAAPEQQQTPPPGGAEAPPAAPVPAPATPPEGQTAPTDPAPVPMPEGQTAPTDPAPAPATPSDQLPEVQPSPGL